jgi:hypothetical protein
MKKTNNTTRALRHLLLAVSAIAFAVPASQAVASNNSWGSEKVQGNGNIKKQARELGHFTGVSLSLPAQMELRMGNTESISIETDDNLLPLIDTVIEDGTLKIRPNKRNLNLHSKTMKIVVQAKDVSRVSLGGSGSIDADTLKGGKLQFDLGGSGAINVKGVESDSLSVTVGGSGNLKTGGGWTKQLSVSIGGSGDVNMGQVKAKEASVSVAGSGEATVAVSDALSVTIAGSGDVNYYGDPKVSKSVVGSGGVKRSGAMPK